MNTAKIKAYAPAARRDFIAAVTQRLNLLGIRADKQGKLQVKPAAVTGSVLQIGGQTFDAKLARARERLVERAQSVGMTALVEQMAYTWFNRLCAIRFMELQGYLEHGFRVLSHPEQAKGFQVLDHVPEVAEALGLDAEHLVGLKLAGNQDEALFRAILLGQCHALHQAMPFLFEALEDDTELLLPDNLTRTDSLLRPLVDSIPASDWQQVEVIGWLYQFYIAERKDQVIGSVVKSEDIPAATQLFTPNWIVQYLVQNSIGRQWLQTYPQSGLQAQMPYYIAPAEQSAAVAAQLAALTPASLDPEALKVLDPACGSGHILVEAYKVLKAIYQERGYRDREIPQLILEKNLFGLDIDERAAQLAGFALLMLVRADDRRIFTRNVKLNVVAMQASPAGLPALWRALNLRGDWQKGTSADLFGGGQMALGDAANDPVYQLLLTLVGLFRDAKTFGSLIDVPAKLLAELQALRETLEVLAERGDTLQQPAARVLLPLVRQAIILAQRYDAVVANPPYMGSKGMNADLKTFAGKHFPNSKSDLFAMFMERAFGLLTANGYNAQVNMQSWMFLSSYEKLRESLLDTRTIMTMAHLGARAFGQISGEVVQTTAWVLAKAHFTDYQPVFFRLIDGNEEEKQRALLARENRHSHTQQPDFKKIPGSPIAYWTNSSITNIFKKNRSIGDIATARQGMATGDNERFVRIWWEVKFSKLGLRIKNNNEAWQCLLKWFPFNKGGSYRKWYGNQEHVINFSIENYKILKNMGNHCPSEEFYFKPAVSWSKVTSGHFSVRYYPTGFIFADAGMSIFSDSHSHLHGILKELNSNFSKQFYEAISPTLNYEVGIIRQIPYVETSFALSKKFIEISKIDWDSFEGSWDFVGSPLLAAKRESVKLAFAAWQAENAAAVAEMQRLEEENNRLFIDAYGLQDELTPAVPLEQITLTVNPRYRYGGNATPAELEQRFQSDTCAELISYAIGCMMGRYRLDKPGLIYAHAGNVDFQTIYGEHAAFPRRRRHYPPH
ncbi:BREX-1 system adenine-specific DNA-methyltransferase PglX [Thiothrix subterranea]|uniref:BREX-1 system adenine-specific DNA-methyltransferase PglX n=1 Tax=Thiothrix subterranea TaxID=2735563 RepID=UPI00280AF9D4|nr:BREX-1 system adenine-specific DNA-methyltransferase PglX [Thiothrix subterranea]